MIALSQFNSLSKDEAAGLLAPCVAIPAWGETLANLVTNAQGRIATFSAAPLPAGHYCLTAETGAWFARAGRESVFTRAQIDFVIGEAAEDHFHLPFLIAPGGWSTYRGS
ncbi:hydroxyisourate hydrolase [Klebsiella pneumoniae]|nr:hydroxyisourate hydrolase [Klebsiella pneumoniae]